MLADNVTGLANAYLDLEPKVRTAVQSWVRELQAAGVEVSPQALFESVRDQVFYAVGDEAGENRKDFYAAIEALEHQRYLAKTEREVSK